jgi:hypothetical protein
LLLRNEYRVTENRILRNQIMGCVHRSDGELTSLAELGKQLGRQALAEVATIVKPETILAWHRTPEAKKFDASPQRKAPGLPLVDAELEALVVRLAQERLPGQCGGRAVLWKSQGGVHVAASLC